MKKNYVRVAVGLGLAQLALFNTTARAQDSTRVLRDVVVTASRSPKKISDIGRVVTVISAEQINRSQGRTLPQLLNTVPGIVYSGAENAPGISYDVYTRGASTGNTLILVDGFPVNNVASIDGAYDLNAFPLDQIDHVEILKGSGSTLYGSDAVAGVINIITRHPKKDGIQNTFQLSAGSYHTFKEAVGLIAKIKHTGIAVNVSNADSKGFPAATDTTGRMGFKNDGFHQQSISLNLNQEISNQLVLNGNLQTSFDKGDLPYGAFTDDKNYNYNKTFFFGGLGAKLKLTKGTLVFNVSQNTVHNNYVNLPPDNDATHLVIKNIGRVTNAEAVFNYNFNKYLDITSGADFKYSNTNQYSSFDSKSYNPGHPDVISPDSAHTSIASAYTSLFLKFDIFHFELGGRYNHHSKYGDNFTYTINPSLLLADRFKIFGTIASAFKSPSLYQLASQYGNIKLKPESTITFEAGVEWELIKNNLTFNTAFYKRDTKNVIYFYTDPLTFASQYQNGSKQNDKGYEAELNYRNSKISTSIYASYVVGKQTDINGKETANLYRRPKNTYGANVNYQVVESFSFGLNYKYTGNRQDQNYSTYPVTIVSLKHYNLLDAHLQFTANKQLTIFADLNNILNEKYIDWLGYNTRRFNIMTGIKYQIN